MFYLLVLGFVIALLILYLQTSADEVQEPCVRKEVIYFYVHYIYIYVMYLLFDGKVGQCEKRWRADVEAVVGIGCLTKEKMWKASPILVWYVFFTPPPPPQLCLFEDYFWGVAVDERGGGGGGWQPNWIWAGEMKYFRMGAKQNPHP